jgi:formylglycine-generating enzyme required for sulfatase activity
MVQRTQVFISYSHTDREWLNRLQTMLIPLQRQGTLNLWADTDIRPGQLWKEEIKQALARAAVAVLLVSPDFLASRFVHEHELPLLLEAARKEGLTIIWIPLRPCLYEETVIGEYQAAYNPAMPLSGLTPTQQETALVEIARKIKSARFTVFSESYPAGPGTEVWVDKLIPASIVEPTPAFQHDPSLRVELRPPTQPAGTALPAIQHVHGWSAPQVQDLQRQTALALGLAVEFRDTLKDNSQGPRMIVIPGGRFLMGSPPDEPGRDSDEQQHEVEVAPFALGKYAVMFEEYDRFAKATRRDKPAHGWRRGRRPVINVSWQEAVAYAEWLSQQTGQAYRLPTEAEWEYACRAGTTTAYHFGASINTDLANYSGGGFFKVLAGFITGKTTVEVGRYPANAWGLHEMHGNVWEWTCSMYSKNYDGSEQRCAEPGTSGPCVLRGGSWCREPLGLRGAARHRTNPHFRFGDLGFRLARTFLSTL